MSFAEVIPLLEAGYTVMTFMAGLMLFATVRALKIGRDAKIGLLAIGFGLLFFSLNGLAGLAGFEVVHGVSQVLSALAIAAGFTYLTRGLLAASVAAEVDPRGR
ncbi:MAG: hypothetical protein WDA16_10460 [Candidatus Thermoplasmatota archaeon]